MKQFVSHIDFLIQKHDCVIIPDFGGFVLSHEFASIATDGAIYPPRVEVGFNPDLKYNDGLLAESYMNVYSISYDAACKKITDTVSRLNTILSLKQSIQIGSLGCLCLDAEGRLSFSPSPDLNTCYAASYGLYTLDISRLVDIVESPFIQNEKPKRRRLIPFQRIFTGVGAAAAAVLIFFVTSTPVLDNNNFNAQKAGFFTDVLNASSGKDAEEMNEIVLDQETVVDEPFLESISDSKIDEKEVLIESVKSKEEVVEVKKNTFPMYYVVVGSAVGKSEAQAVLTKIRKQGYNDADIIESPNRSRIYVAAFEDRTLGEKYLEKVKSDNPKFNDAWLYIKRK